MRTVQEQRTYRVIVSRERSDWLADVVGLDGAHTFARNLESLDRYVREVVVLAAALPDGAEAELDLDWEYHTGEPVLDEQLAQLRHLRREIDSLRGRVESDTRQLARKLAGYMSVRDSAALLGVSRARVQQLISE
jgi:hypothetical protein